MSHNFDEAPPLPREPTALNVPAAMRPAVEQPEPLPHSVAPPPPKFPSLTDVALPSAQAAAANLAASSTTAPTVTPAPAEQPAQPEQTPFELPLSPDDIRAAIERDSVTPGSGAKKAVEVGHSIWTDKDQQTLDRLLKEGQSVYVPPDVVSNDLLVSRASSYVYVPVPAEGVDDFAQDSSVSARVDAWNQVVSKQQDQSHVAPVAAATVTTAATAAALSSEPVPSTQPAADTDDRAVASEAALLPETAHIDTENDAAQTDQTADASAVKTTPPSTPQPAAESASSAVQAVERASPISSQPKSFDASTSIFANSFITVPVKSHVPLADKDAMKGDAEDSEHLGKPTQVKLRDDATAEIKILQDYGLKGGHESKVNDAAFIDPNTLITCGSDGKVCIWDLQAKHVRSEFVPNDGQSVTMVYPIPDDDPSQPLTLMTFSERREMRIWTVDSKQAVLLRTTTIQQSDKDLYMSIPSISKELKARAAAAVAAAAVTTTESPQGDTTEEATDAPPAPSPPEETQPDEEEAAGADDTTPPQASAPEPESKDEDKEKKRFSLTKVLSFGRSGGRKAVAS
eukprot:TRINITY_DN55780_c0_g1_i1.p1 TRINITY_DN55780_c0_g1~~TRINITY_DN55780_c0_g1_i1.p1  ORF type:complete len:571 (+),score=130.20 TRINITY_DN55780_c0_g1_i1:567-2279(+)